MSNPTQGHSSKVQWGTLIAGAAIVVGAVMFAPSVMDKIPEMSGDLLNWMQNLGHTIGNVIMTMIGKTSAPTAISDATIETIKKISGVALIGGGATYLMNRPDEPIQVNVEAPEDFRTRLEMDKMNKLMMTRLAFAGHPAAQSAMAQPGRA